MSEMKHWASTKALENVFYKLKKAYWNYNGIYFTGWRSSNRNDGFDKTGIDYILTCESGVIEAKYHILLQLKSSKERLDEHLARPNQDVWFCVANDDRMEPLDKQVEDGLKTFIDSLKITEINEEAEAALLLFQEQEVEREKHRLYLEKRGAEKWKHISKREVILKKIPNKFDKYLRDSIEQEYLHSLFKGENLDNLDPDAVMICQGHQYIYDAICGILGLKQMPDCFKYYPDSEINVPKEITADNVIRYLTYHERFYNWDSRFMPQRYIRELEAGKIRTVQYALSLAA